jgi:hypothetical protein
MVDRKPWAAAWCTRGRGRAADPYPAPAGALPAVPRMNRVARVAPAATPPDAEGGDGAGGGLRSQSATTRIQRTTV